MPRNYDDDTNPPSRSEELVAAKARFSTAMLGNDVFFQIVKTGLVEREDVGGGRDSDLLDLEDFQCEPTLSINAAGNKKLGLRFNASTTFDLNDGIFKSVSMAHYDYLALASVDGATNEGTLDPEYEMALARAGFEPKSEEALSVVQSWQVGYNEIVREFRGELTINPMGGTLVLREELERTAVVNYPL